MRKLARQSSEEGNFLIMAVLFLAFAASAVLTTMSVVGDRARDVSVAGNELVARQAAQGAVHQAIAFLEMARDMSSIASPFQGLDNLDRNSAEGPGGYSQLWSGQVIRDRSGRTVGEHDVFLDVKDRGDPDYRDIAIAAYAYVPSKAAYESRIRDAVRSDAHCTVRIGLSPSPVFDYAYFINHWGWFFGDSIVANGDVRSNGQFDFGNYSSTVNGSPRYTGATGSDLTGYLDDNKDGVTDGSDGGSYSGFQILRAGRVQGMGGAAANQHSNGELIPMPNISDLTSYEAKAKDMGSTIQVGGVTYVNGVLGDVDGSKANLYLVGTPDRPIVMNGPVVVRGSVILSGVVTGRGSIYAGGNVYIAKDLTLKNPPSTWRPAANDEASTEAWIRSNSDKDGLGLFARQHIVVGDYTNSSWQSNVSAWVNNPSNKSKEDAGLDGVQNTRAGRDGILGTADDDVLEEDGVWTVSRYTQADAQYGLIPSGKSVGDPIPGTGEDIDGDGIQDGPTQMSEFNIPCPLQNSGWASNALTDRAVQYNSIANCNVKQVDAVLYTNHTLAALMLNWGGDILFNGAVVSRNESIIYGANRIVMNHDERLTARNGDAFGLYVPRAWKAIEVRQWEFDKALPPGTDLTCPASIARYFTVGGPRSS